MPAEVRGSSTSWMQRNLANPHPHPTTHPAPRLPCCSAQIDCDVPLEEAFALWEDRERIPQWMPWITSVVVQQASLGGQGARAGMRPCSAQAGGDAPQVLALSQPLSVAPALGFGARPRPVMPPTFSKLSVMGCGWAARDPRAPTGTGAWAGRLLPCSVLRAPLACTTAGQSARVVGPAPPSCATVPGRHPQDDPRLSRWTLSTYQFNRQWEFSWLALNLTPLRNQKIHWRSVPGSTGGSLGSSLEVQNRCGDGSSSLADLRGWDEGRQS